MHEPEREQRSLGQIFGTLWHDVTRVAKSRTGWTGMLLFLSPVGTAALVNYFAGIARDYRATDGMVAFVNGPVNGLVTAAGSLIGGYLCDRFSRRADVPFGRRADRDVRPGHDGRAADADDLRRRRQRLSVHHGLCYSAFSAAVLETIGKGGAAASTQYALFVSCGNLAIAYVGFIDTRFHEGYGPRGLLAVDAALNVAGIIALYFLFRAFGGFKKHAEAAA